MSNVSDIAAIGDLQAIRNRLAQHSRGIDRASAEMIADCYYPDGTVDYRFYNGPARDFAQIIAGAQKAAPVTLHRTAQMWVRLDGSDAVSESYVMACAQSADEDGTMKQRFICGRYLDRHRKERGEWRLTHRTYVLDTNMNWPGSFEKPEPTALEHLAPTGGHGTSDPGIALLTLAAARNKTQGRGARPMNAAASESATIDAIISRQQVADLTMAYCRGVDRAEPALLESLFHEDSTVVSGAFNGSGKEFATAICRLVEDSYEQTFHSIANQWIEVSGDSAIGETYVIAASTTRDAEPQADTLTGGRYVDRFERRDGAWKFSERTFVLDWARSEPSTRDMAGGMYSALDLQGSRGKADPVYALQRDARKG